MQSTKPGNICDHAAHIAASETGVPVRVLLAITRTETGRSRKGMLEPWPWTVNMEGTGKWFSNVEEAVDFAKKHHSRGARSFDIGCFQLNYKWHGENFLGIEDMFDPLNNALYAAKFLSGLQTEKGSWSKAAAAYHSRTPVYAKKYEARFKKIFAALPEFSKPASVPNRRVFKPTSRQNLYPLLVAGENARTLGSLTPLRTGGRRPLFGRDG